MNQPIEVTRLRLVVVALVFGLLTGAGIYLGATALGGVSENRRERITREALTERQVEQIARRVFRLERPTPREIVARLREGLPLCSRDPLCARDLRRIAASVPAPAPTAPRGRSPRPRRPQARTNPPRRPQRPQPPAVPRPPDPPREPDPPLVDPPPIDPDGPGPLPPIDLPPLDAPRLCDAIPIPGICARLTN